VPPCKQNFTTPPKPANAKKPEPAYHAMAHDDKIATNVYDRAMDLQITLTQHKLLSLSPKVCSQVHEAKCIKEYNEGDSHSHQ